MSAPIKGLTVTLDPTLNDDAADEIICAIGLLRGVIAIESHVTDVNHHLAVSTAKEQLREKFWELLR